jgi:hypothetical protein
MVRQSARVPAVGGAIPVASTIHLRVPHRACPSRAHEPPTRLMAVVAGFRGHGVRDDCGVGEEGRAAVASRCGIRYVADRVGRAPTFQIRRPRSADDALL